MKQGKNPTLKQKLFISELQFKSIHLNPFNWLVIKDTSEELHLVKREGNKGVRIWSKKEKCWKA